MHEKGMLRKYCLYVKKLDRLCKVALFFSDLWRQEKIDSACFSTSWVRSSLCSGFYSRCILRVWRKGWERKCLEKSENISLNGWKSTGRGHSELTCTISKCQLCAFDANGDRILVAGEQEGVFIVAFNMNKIQMHRSKTIWGNAADLIATNFCKVMKSIVSLSGITV